MKSSHTVEWDIVIHIFVVSIETTGREQIYFKFGVRIV